MTTTRIALDNEGYVDHFCQLMKQELLENAHKGDWSQFICIKDILYELEYHKAKLYMAYKVLDVDSMKEYAVDCANCMMFMVNAIGMLKRLEKPKECFY